MRKDKWIKSALALVILGLLLPLAGTAPAASASWWGDIASGKKIKAPKFDKEIDAAIHRAGVKRERMELDDVYYSDAETKERGDDKYPIAERTFTIQEASFVEFHAITYGRHHVVHNVIDEDGREIGGDIEPRDGHPVDTRLFLRRGRYTLRTRYGTATPNGSRVEYRVKGTVEPLGVNHAQDYHRPYDADMIRFNEEIRNILPAASRTEEDAQYYIFQIPARMTVRISLWRLTPYGSCRLTLQDSDERPVDTLYISNSEIAEKDFVLAPGTYYLKAERENRFGCAYRFRLSPAY